MEPKLLIIHQGKGTSAKQMEEFFTRTCWAESIDNLDKGVQLIKAGQSDKKFKAVFFELAPSKKSVTHFCYFMEKCAKVTLPLILIGSSTQKEILETCTDYHIFDFLIRPLTDFDLNRVLRNITYINALIAENKIMKNRLRVFEQHLDRIFSGLEEKVKRNIEKLRKKNEMWQKIFHHVNLGILFVDKDFIIIQANTFFSRIIDKPLAQIIGQKYFEVMGLKDDLLTCPGYMAMKTRKIQIHEKKVEKNNNCSKNISLTVVPVFDDMNKINGFIEYYQHITKQGD